MHKQGYRTPTKFFICRYPDGTDPVHAMTRLWAMQIFAVNNSTFCMDFQGVPQMSFRALAERVCQTISSAMEYPNVLRQRMSRLTVVRILD